MSHDAHNQSAHNHGVGHIVPPKILIATAAALLVLTYLTVMASKVDFHAIDMPEMNIIVCLGIALVKATLVCLFFMHLRWDRPFNAFVIVGSLSLVVLFIIFAMTDSAEYQPDIVKGVTPTIKAELDKLPPPLPESEILRMEHGHNP